MAASTLCSTSSTKAATKPSTAWRTSSADATENVVNAACAGCGAAVKQEKVAASGALHSGPSTTLKRSAINVGMAGFQSASKLQCDTLVVVPWLGLGAMAKMATRSTTWWNLRVTEIYINAQEANQAPLRMIVALKRTTCSFDQFNTDCQLWSPKPKKKETKKKKMMMKKLDPYQMQRF